MQDMWIYRLVNLGDYIKGCIKICLIFSYYTTTLKRVIYITIYIFMGCTTF